MTLEVLEAYANLKSEGLANYKELTRLHNEVKDLKEANNKLYSMQDMKHLFEIYDYGSIFIVGKYKDTLIAWLEEGGEFPKEVQDEDR